LIVDIIQKKKGIDDLVKRYSPKKVEEEKRIIAADALDYAPLFEKYLQYVETFCPRSLDVEFIDEILSPDDINLFLQASIPFEDLQSSFPFEDKAYCIAMGLFLSRLIQNSYQAGHNNFYLNTKNILPLSELGMCFQGEEENPLKLTIDGDTGKNLGSRATNSMMTVHGNTISLGDFISHCTFILHGKLEKHSLVELFGKPITDCIFKTPNQETLQTLLKIIHKHKYRDTLSGNKIISIQEDGSEEMIKDYS